MDTYKLIEIHDDGTGYVVFHWADGSSCGQQIHGAPIGDKAKFDAFMADLMEATAIRHFSPAVTVVSADIKDLMRAPVTVNVAMSAELAELRGLPVPDQPQAK